MYYIKRYVGTEVATFELRAIMRLDHVVEHGFEKVLNEYFISNGLPNVQVEPIFSPSSTIYLRAGIEIGTNLVTLVRRIFDLVSDLVGKNNE